MLKLFKKKIKNPKTSSTTDISNGVVTSGSAIDIPAHTINTADAPLGEPNSIKNPNIKVDVPAYNNTQVSSNPFINSTINAQPQHHENNHNRNIAQSPSSVNISTAAATVATVRTPASNTNNPQFVGDSPLIMNFTYDERANDPRAPHAVTVTTPPTGSSSYPPAYSPNMYQSSAPPPDSLNNFNIGSPTPSSNASVFPSPSQMAVSPLTSHTASSSYQGSPMPPAHNTASVYQTPPPPPVVAQMPYPVPTSTASWAPTYQHQPYNPVPYDVLGSQGYNDYNQNQTYPIIMAIDWGTTYSSMAYAYQQDGEVHEVSTWPSQSHNYPKVPTCNLYGPGSKDILMWGYPAKHAMAKPPYKNHVLLSKYKLHLDQASGPHPPLPNGLAVVDAIADYLRLFHAHVVTLALRGFGSAFEQHHIQYCLSVPAMWTDSAKSLMRQAALQAGMISPSDPPHRLLLISEPEAAALYCEKKCDQFSIGHGERFMICDAGGGTVDLIVFEVAVGPQGRTLREVTRGSGHSCGSIFLDERMEALLRRRFSSWQEKGLTPANWVQLMDTFIHNVKPLFDGVEDQYINMPAVPGRAELTDYDIGLEDGVLAVSAEEMRREVFDPVVDDVLRLIQHQLQQTQFNCQAIFMVGGFGCSGYLLKRVQSEFGSIVRLIAVPPRPELAVVRGAALAGISPRVVAARVARRWYGVDSLMAFEHGVDMPHKQTRDHEGQLRARDRFSVYVMPGQQIGVDECITKRYITFQYPKPISSPLFACSSLTMPRYVDTPQVEKIGDFTIPLPYIPGALPGHKVAFELRMYFGATEIRAEAEVNGVIVSTRCQFTG
ncbi:hypothetical protein BGZ46_010637 [Entomortierella lignicola]|nr:hypothetical protein BGZ46_010637 [Entomortierella lignicola]